MQIGFEESLPSPHCMIQEARMIAASFDMRSTSASKSSKRTSASSAVAFANVSGATVLLSEYLWRNSFTSMSESDLSAAT